MSKKIKAAIVIAVVMICCMGGLLVWKTTNFFAKDEWTITQYGPRDINLSFYTMYNPKKGFIVIDGGWIEDAQYVRDIVALHGNKIDAWILTHPHQDHMGAFNVIYPDPQGIEIDRIYTVDMATPEECFERASWDSIDTYCDFLELQVENLQYVYTNEELKICDLQIKILSAYGGHVEQNSHDYLNDGSMMFKVTNKDESMLFCADVGVGLSDYLLNHWGDELKADYLQMGHHGYGGLKDDFYTKVAPRVAFFDAPAHMMQDETGRFDNSEHVKLMEGMSSEVLSFVGCPHAVILK